MKKIIFELNSEELAKLILKLFGEELEDYFYNIEKKSYKKRKDQYKFKFYRYKK